MAIEPRTGRSPGAVLAACAVLALLGLAAAAVLFSSWSRIQHLDPAAAQESFAAIHARATAAGRRAAQTYLLLDDAGHVRVQRQLESDSLTDLKALHLVAWEPEERRLFEVTFPFWFVRLKMNDHINLGSMTSALSGDWDNLDLKVSVQELRRRGAGIVLDHTRADGTRLLLWSEAQGSR